MGKRELTCTPWGMPTFSIFGWQKPCYLLQDGYADTFQELIDTVEWSNYGTESGNPRCANCMVHSGYEASGVNYTFGSFKGLMATAKAFFSSDYKDDDAAKLLNDWQPAGHGPPRTDRHARHLQSFGCRKPRQHRRRGQVTHGDRAAGTPQDRAVGPRKLPTRRRSQPAGSARTSRAGFRPSPATPKPRTLLRKPSITAAT